MRLLLAPLTMTRTHIHAYIHQMHTHTLKKTTVFLPAATLEQMLITKCACYPIFI